MYYSLRISSRNCASAIAMVKYRMGIADGIPDVPISRVMKSKRPSHVWRAVYRNGCWCALTYSAIYCIDFGMSSNRCGYISGSVRSRGGNKSHRWLKSRATVAFHIRIFPRTLEMYTPDWSYPWACEIVADHWWWRSVDDSPNFRMAVAVEERL